MQVLPWVITCLVVLMCAWCLIVMSGQLDAQDERLAILESAMVLGGPTPYSVVDDPVADFPTEPLSPATEPHGLDLADGKRIRVDAARQANRSRPTPFPRENGRHRA